MTIKSKEVKTMTKLRPRFIMGLEHNCVTEIYAAERRRIEEEADAELRKLECEYTDARSIERGLMYPVETPAYKMTMAEISSQKVMNGLDPNKPLTLEMFSADKGDAEE